MAVGNPNALAALAQVKSNFDSGIFRPLQEAAAWALAIEPEWIAARNKIYQERMGIVVEGLGAAGIDASRPRATLYVWARIPTHAAVLVQEHCDAQTNKEPPASTSISEAFSLSLLRATGVAVAPGSFFGPAGEGYLRISITAPTPKIREAMTRIREFLATE